MTGPQDPADLVRMLLDQLQTVADARQHAAKLPEDSGTAGRERANVLGKLYVLQYRIESQIAAIALQCDWKPTTQTGRKHLAISTEEIAARA